MTRKILTISIAAYNVSKYIQSTLSSLICDRMDKLEVIIENDGSKDDTPDIVLPFVEKYPDTFILVNKKNGGYGSTINKSLELATGKYFKQLDGDDWFENESLNSFIDLLEKTDVDCVYTPYYEVYEGTDKKVLRTLDERAIGEYHIDQVIKDEQFLRMHALTFKTVVLKEINLKIEEHCFYTDQEFIIYPMLKVKQIYVSDLPIYMYRLGQEGQSVSMEGYLKHCEEHKKVVLNLLAKYNDLEQCSLNTQKRLKSHLQILICIQYNIYLYAGNKKKELVEFDAVLKRKYPAIYTSFCQNNGKMLNLLVKSKFTLYCIAAWYMRKK